MTDLFDLTGKVALVTGGNGGIGLGMAEGLAGAGAAVEIWGRNAAKTEQALEQLSKTGAKVTAQVVDVADEQAVIDAFAKTVASHGRVDNVIANAGIGFGAGPFVDLSTDAFRKVMSVNVEGVMFTLREAARHMTARPGGGSLVAVASTAAIEGAGRNQAYGASKGAVTAMMRAIAVELARYDIRANSILPGWIATEMTEGAQDNDKFNANVISRVPIRRWGEQDDFAGIAVYLASDASKFHTGRDFVIDGGYTIF